MNNNVKNLKKINFVKSAIDIFKFLKIIKIFKNV